MAPVKAQRRFTLQRLALFLLCVPAIAQGLSSDRNQPITIEADRATLNEKEGSSVYEGNVHLQQGTLNLRGNRMTVLIIDDRLAEIVLTGKPASYRQRPDDSDSDQHAEAGRIEYYATDERMVLLENARIWQSGAEEFSSERIIFNLKNNTVSAGGSGASDRVRIILQPKNRPDAGPQDPDADPSAADAGAQDPDVDPSTADAGLQDPDVDQSATDANGSSPDIPQPAPQP